MFLKFFKNTAEQLSLLENVFDVSGLLLKHCFWVKSQMFHRKWLIVGPGPWLYALLIINFIHLHNEQPFQTPPKQEDYANFQNYLATNEIEREIESDAENITEENLGIQFHWIEDAEPKEYNEPPFPPQQPHFENEANAVEIQSRLTVEEKAQEWYV